MNNDRKCRYDIVGLSGELDVPVEELKELYDTYLSELDEQIQSMYDLEKAKDWHMLERTVHNLKGMSQTVFVYDIYQEAVTLDDFLKKDITENAHKLIENIDEISKETRKEILSFFRN